MSATDPASGDELLPERIGGYRVKELLGAGGMGKVYGAVDEGLGREVAVKTLLPELAADAVMSARFLREARAMAKVSSPHVVTVYQVGEESGVPFLVMERLEGEDLARHIARRGRVPVDEAIAYIRDAVLGLEAALHGGHVHRDVKPANLFLTEGGLKLTDFGLARPVDGSADVTAAGLVVGTPHYLAPELARGEEATVASDVYALGATLFCMLTGRPPFEGGSALEVLSHQLTAPVPDLRREGFTDVVASLVEKMLKKAPGERFGDYPSLLAALEAARAGDATSSAVAMMDTAVRPAVGESSGLPSPMADTVVTPKSVAPLDATRVERTQKAAASTAGPFTRSRLVGAGIAAAVLILVVALVPGGRIRRIDNGQGREVLAELEKIPDAEWSGELDFIDGYARLALDDPRGAMSSWADAVKAGFLDDRMLEGAIAAFDTAGGSAAEDFLASWPDDDVEDHMRDLLDDDSYAVRKHAIGVLDERDVATDEERARVGLRQLKEGQGCQQRRAGLLLLKQSGKSEEALEAIREADRDKLGNMCMALDIQGAAGAVKRRMSREDD